MLPKPIIKGSKNWLNTTLEEYGDFIFAHGRYNTLENLDLKIRKSLEIVDPIEDNHASENQDHPFGKGTHPGNLLIGLVWNSIKVPIITKLPYKHCQPEQNIVPIQSRTYTIYYENTSTTKQNSPVMGFHPILKLLENIIR